MQAMQCIVEADQRLPVRHACRQAGRTQTGRMMSVQPGGTEEE